MKKIKFFLIAGVIIVVLFFILNLNSNQKPDNQVNIPTPNKTETDLIPNNQSPKQVSWNISDVKIEPNLTVYKVLGEADMSKISQNFVKAFAFGNPKLDNDNLTVFENQQNNTILELNKADKKISYYQNLLKQPISLTGPRLETEKIKNLFLKLTNQNLNLNGLSIAINSVEYEKVINPRFVSSDQASSQIVKINAYYAIKNYPIMTATGFPLVARFAWDGSLIKLDANLLSSIIAKQGDYPLRSFEDIKSMPSDSFKVININGGAQYDLSNFDSKSISEVNINQSYIGYLDLKGFPYLRPYLICNGKGILDTGPATITLAVPLLKD